MTVEIHGFCEARFGLLEDAFRANFEDGGELGASMAATQEGRMVVDLWGGFSDVARARPWQRDTIVPVSSTSKIASTIADLMIVDRFGLDLDAPIARWWPQYGGGGKQDDTLRQAFSHSTGAPSFDPPVGLRARCDLDAALAALAATPHWFEGRPRIVYHAVTYGLPMAVVRRRLDGRGPRQFFAEEVAAKAGADFQIGLASKGELARLAEVVPVTHTLTPPEGSLLARLFMSFRAGEGDMTSWPWRSAQLPAASGVGNGRSVARIGAIMAMKGELDGVRYISTALAEEATREQAYGVCPYLGPVKFGLGFGLHSAEYRAPTPTCFHWGGRGGSWGLMDQATGVSFGYTPNNFAVEAKGDMVDPRQTRYARALHKILPTL